ncbi:MAG: hypothetical protein ACE5FT_03330 [Candidatus Nanoarchaeia archaeon]
MNEAKAKQIGSLIEPINSKPTPPSGNLEHEIFFWTIFTVRI